MHPHRLIDAGKAEGGVRPLALPAIPPQAAARLSGEACNCRKTEAKMRLIQFKRTAIATNLVQALRAFFMAPIGDVHPHHPLPILYRVADLDLNLRSRPGHRRSMPQQHTE